MKKENKLRKLQLCELEILKYFISICEEHGFTYYISGGTFLGAVRHKGFIPWDDDVDVAMPRSDYEKFLKLFEDNDKKFKISTYKDTSETVHYQAKLMDSSIQLLNTSGQENQVWSAWIDIFPLDGMPNNFFLRKLHGLHLMYLRARLKFTCFDQVNLKEKHRNIIERTLIFIGLHTNFMKNGSPITYLDKIDKCLKKYPSEKSNYYINFMGAYKLKSVLRKDVYYQEGATYDFEGMKLFGPKNYDKYLSHFYGDYMTPPSASEKNKHNTELIDG